MGMSSLRTHHRLGTDQWLVERMLKVVGHEKDTQVVSLHPGLTRVQSTLDTEFRPYHNGFNSRCDLQY